MFPGQHINIMLTSMLVMKKQTTRNRWPSISGSESTFLRTGGVDRGSFNKFLLVRNLIWGGICSSIEENMPRTAGQRFADNNHHNS